MFIKRRRWLVFNFISLLLLGAFFTGLFFYLRDQSTRLLYTVCPNTNSEGTDLLVMASQPETDAQYVANEDFVFDVTLTKSWLEDERKNLYGTQYDITFTNLSGRDLENWRMRMEAPPGSTLDSDWSGIFQFEDDILTELP